MPAKRRSRPHPRHCHPRAFRQTRILVVGCGDVGLRLLREQAPRARFTGTARSQDQAAKIRLAGARALAVDLDNRRDRKRLTGLSARIIYLAPPDTANDRDNRLRAVLASLGCQRCAQRIRLAYCGTTGVYGDAAGALLDETAPIRPRSQRALRRADAERQLRRATATTRTGPLHSIRLRAPGIYAQERLPVKRLLAGLPALRAGEDSYSSHIHADDLARVAWVAVLRAPNARVYNATDGQQQKMGDYFDQVAAHFELDKPPRLSADEAQAQVSAMMWTFMRESRRLSNRRLLDELRVRLRYPTVAHTLAETPHDITPFINQQTQTLKGR